MFQYYPENPTLSSLFQHFSKRYRISSQIVHSPRPALLSELQQRAASTCVSQRYAEQHGVLIVQVLENACSMYTH
jgi:hypothetical protein